MKSIVLLLRFSIRHLWRQRWQTFLLVVGILLGVTVVIAIDFANESSKKAISLTTQSITGKATHQIFASGTGIPETYFTEMVRTNIFSLASPITEGYVNVNEFNLQPILILGIDPLLDYPFRSYLGEDVTQLSQLLSIISRPDTGIIARDLSEEFGISIGDEINYIFEGKSAKLKIVGLISSEELLAKESLKGVIIVDIATAQEAFGKKGILDRIELIVENQTTENLIKNNLEPGMVFRSTQEQNEQLENMVGAFQLNLTALSLLALVVGVFLIYNTMTFSVVQRRELIGLYRSLGFFRYEIFIMIIFEAIVIGVIGTIFGVIFGSILGRETVNLILQTINDLYYVTTVKSVTLPISSVIKGIVLGIFATIVVSIPPAIEAMQVTPRTAKIRSGLEEKVQKNIKYITLLGLLLFFVSYFLLFSPIFEHLWWAFTATLLVVIGCSIFSALGLFLILPSLSKVMKRYFGLISGMAARELYRSLSRTAVAVSSLMVAVSVTIGMSIMINSFRHTVSVWLLETLAGDIYISVPNQFSNRSSAYIDEDSADLITQYSGIEKIDTLLTINGISGLSDIQINVITNQEIANERIFTKIAAPIDLIWESLLNNKIIIAEPLANRLNLKLGESLPIETPVGSKKFEITGIFSDYTTSQGYIMMARPVFDQFWNIDEISAISIKIPDNFDVDKSVQELKNLVNQKDQKLLIRSNKNLRNDVMVVFDRTFAVTDALRFIATFVSFIGILSAILIILIDRRREFGMLKAIGIRRKELNQLLLTETGLMGLFAGLFAIPTGIVISLILVYVINLRSFGWTIQFYLDGWSIVQGVIISILAAFIATVYPLQKLNRLKPIQVMKDE
ncbi:MAG: FtsX-like permease family protein [Anaerolineaceae bacterium]|nr:FtsX-like permease family protein [Anaerolineaceae bacterium]